MVLNNKNKIIKYEYSILENAITDEDSDYNSKDAYWVLNLNIYLDGIKINKTAKNYIDAQNNSKEEIISSKSNIENHFDVLYELLKGIDGKDYLVIYLFQNNLEMDGRIIPFIVNENGTIIYDEFMWLLDTNISIMDPSSKLYSVRNNKKGSEYLVEKDKMYIVSCLDDGDVYEGVRDERYSYY